MTAPVVIVGGGSTGVTAATLLAQYGVECLVLDRWDGVYPQPRAVHLDDEVCRILGRLGVGQEFAAISRPARGLQLRNRAMRVLAEFQRDPAAGAHGYAQANMFDQPELEALLRTNLKRYPRATLRGNSEVTGIARIAQDCAEVTFTDRVSGREHSVPAKYVLGCDGANSVVREAIGAKMQDLRFQQRWLVVDVATDADLNQWDGVHQICDPHRAGTFMRIGDNRYRWEFQLRPGETAGDFNTVAALDPLIAPWVAGVEPERLELVRVAEYTFRAQLADQWRRGNIFLLGDAAHLTPPFIGQGLGAGLRDAMNLSWKLAGVVNGWLAPSTLDSYEQERKPHVRHMIRFAQTVGRTMTAGGDVGDAVRSLVLPRLHLIPGVRKKIVDSTTPALHRGAWVKTSGRRSFAGRLCPNPVLAEGKQFDTIIGPRFAVVTTVPLTAAQRSEVTSRGAVVVSAGPASAAAEWLRNGRAVAAVVRPDRTVLCAGRDIADVCSTVPMFPVPPDA